MRWTALVIGVAFLGLGASGLAAADEPSGWEFEVVPYVWLPGNFGTVDVKGHSAAVDVTVLDVLKLATSGNAFTGTGYFAARYDRWSAFVDAFGGYAEESATEHVPTQFCNVSVAATAEVRPVIVDFAVGYRLGQWSLANQRRPVSLGVYAGTRYMHFGTHLRASAGVAGGLQRSADVSESFNWADPMIGLRWEVPVLDQVSLDFRGDIGGFGASSQLIWGIVGDARYWLSWRPWSAQPWVGAGYRAVAFDRGNTVGNIEIQFRGPFGGMGFVF